jgi:hypothetical protein
LRAGQAAFVRTRYVQGADLGRRQELFLCVGHPPANSAARWIVGCRCDMMVH